MTAPVKLLVVFLLVSACMMSASRSAAQGQDDDSNSVSCLTFRGQPPSRTRSFLIFENGLHGQRDNGSSGNVAYILDLGWMKNTGDRHAFGGSVCFISDFFGDPILGFRPRYRYWLSDSFALDLTTGLALYSTADNVPMPGLLSSVSLSLKDLVSVDLTVMVRRGYDSSEYRDDADEPYVIRTLGLSTRSYSTALLWTVIGMIFVVDGSSFDAG